MRRAAQVQMQNQTEIVESYPQRRWPCSHLQYSEEFAAFVGRLQRGRSPFQKSKTDDRKKLTPGEVQFFEDWMGYSVRYYWNRRCKTNIKSREPQGKQWQLADTAMRGQ